MEMTKPVFFFHRSDRHYLFYLTLFFFSLVGYYLVDSLNRLFKSQLSRVHLNSIISLFQRCYLSVCIVIVTLDYILQYLVICRLIALFLKLLETSFCSGFRCSCEEYLHVSVWQNHSADISAVHDDVVFFCDILLKFKQKFSYLRYSRHL